MPGTITLTNHTHNANFYHITPGTNTLKSHIQRKLMSFQVTPGRTTLPNHMHNPNFCFCHDTPRNKHTKIIYIQ